MSRPRGDHAGRREAIARAAARAIATRGLEQVTLRDIAATLGVTTGVLTHYFPSKDALVAFTKARAFDGHLARAREAAAGADGIERLHAVVAELLPVDAERRTSWRLLVAFHGSAVGSASMRRAHDRRMRAWFAFFAELVAPLGVADAEATGMAIALFVEGMAVHVAMMQPPRPAAWQVAFAREQVERLVRPAPPPRRRSRPVQPAP
ncbi:MAG: TetR/AcrR family transcriptional regulator [Gemmatimonadetes bacterium]|nr:TetR/AcrR family transcriptional regulator [Gemmatimonadota bacterium]